MSSVAGMLLATKSKGLGFRVSGSLGVFRFGAYSGLGDGPFLNTSPLNYTGNCPYALIVEQQLFFRVHGLVHWGQQQCVPDWASCCEFACEFTVLNIKKLKAALKVRESFKE